MAVNAHALWVESYRPQTIEHYIFHDNSQRQSVCRMIADKSIPNLLFSGTQGCGKAQPLYSKVLTPAGWVNMEDIKIGQTLVTPTGKHSAVTGVFPQGKKDIYSITFHDGSSTECCLDHLWECYFIDGNNDKKAKKHIVDTQTIVDYLNTQKDKNTKNNVSIPLVQPIEFTEHNTEFDHYLMGVLIGDGTITGGTPRITSIDNEVIEECNNRLLHGYSIKLIKNTKKEYNLINENRKNYGGRIGTEENSYTKHLRAVGLYGKRSHEKFIPEPFKRGSVVQRWELIQGLMDTDGTISKDTRSASYTTTSAILATDIQEILWSLGCTCTITSKIPTYSYTGEKKKGKLAFTLFINHNDGNKQFFKLSRKKDLGRETFGRRHSKDNIILRRRIVSIEYKEQEQAQCIKIDDPDELYITDNYIVTHNTTIAQILINEMDIEETDILTLNASDENSVDVMREKIKGFISTFAMGPFKIVHLEEADYITPNGQGILRRLMEEYSDTSRFILTCNYENKIIPAIQSRCHHYRFKSPDKDDITEKVAMILLTEGVKFDLELLDKYISVGYPDIRKIINLLQQNSIDKILQPLNTESESGDYKFKLLDLIEKDDWASARKLVCECVIAEEWESVYKFLYQNLYRTPKFSDGAKWEAGIVIIADHLYKHSLCADPEINAAAMFIRLTQI